MQDKISILKQLFFNLSVQEKEAFFSAINEEKSLDVNHFTTIQELFF